MDAEWMLDGCWTPAVLGCARFWVLALQLLGLLVIFYSLEVCLFSDIFWGVSA